jgi:hypothetical protein
MAFLPGSLVAVVAAVVVAAVVVEVPQLVAPRPAALLRLKVARLLRRLQLLQRRVLHPRPAALLPVVLLREAAEAVVVAVVVAAVPLQPWFCIAQRSKSFFA